MDTHPYPSDFNLQNRSGASRPTGSKRLISSEPLVNYLHYRLEIILSAATAMFIFYTTCLPTIENGLEAVSAQPLSKQDIIQNILLYIPLGFCVVLAIRRKRLSWTAIALATLIIASSLSCLAELTQRFFPGRVSSSLDILCNVTGAAIGGACAFLFRTGTNSYRRQLRDRLRNQPLFMTFLLASSIYLLMSLVPFQLDLTPKTESTVFNPVRLAALTLSLDAQAMSLEGDNRKQYDHAFDLAAALLSVALLSFFVCCSLRREFEFSTLSSAMLLLWIVLLISSILTLFQMFMRHSEFRVIMIPISLAGAMVGFGAAWVKRFRIGRSPNQILVWAWLAALVSLGLILARELNPFEFDYSSPSVREHLLSMCWIPFKQYFASPGITSPSSDMLAKFGRFFVFGVFLSLSLKTSGVITLHTRIRAGYWTTLAVAVGIEIAQLGCPQRFLDITHLLLGIAGTLCGMIALQWWLDLLKSKQPQKNVPANRSAAPKHPPAVLG